MIPEGMLREPMQVLLCEDEPDAAELIVRALRNAGFSFTWERVDTEADFLRAVDDEPDLVLADFSIPGFGALRVLEILRERRSRIPVIIVSGTIGEELAATTIRKGARDYVLKDNLQGLERAVTVALEGARLGEQVRASERAREESEARYADLFESANDFIFTHDLNGVLTSINRAGERATGYGREERLGRMNVIEILPPESHEMIRGILTRQLAGEVERPTFEVEILRADGGRLPIEVSTNLIYENDEPVGVLGVARDITERRESQAALDESRQRLQALFDSTLDAILIADDEGRYTDANLAACELTGYARDELLEKSVWDLTPGGTQEAGRELWRAFTRAGTQTGDYLILRADGSILETEYRAVANIVPGFHLSAVRDVSERRRAERALGESEERFRQLADNTHQVFWVAEVADDGGFDISYVNPAFSTVWGRDEVFKSADDLLQAIHPADRDDMAERIAANRSEVPVEANEYRIIRPDGAVRWIRDFMFPIVDEEGHVYRLTGLAEDITDRKEAELALRERVKELRCLYTVSSKAETQTVSKAELCAFICEELVAAMQFPELASVTLEVDKERFSYPDPARLEGFELGAPITGRDRIRGFVCVRYAEDVSFLLPEEQTLLENIAGTLGRWLERTEIEAEREALLKRERELSSELHLILESTGEGINVVDGEGRTTLMNRAGAEMLGYEPEDVLGDSVHDLVHHKHEDGSPYPVESCPVHRVLQTGEGSRVSNEVYWRRDGTSFPVVYSSFPIIRDGQTEGAVVAFTDVTDQRQAQRELERSFEMLQRAAEDRRRLLARLVRAQEEERERIAADIHDDSVQVMTAVGMRLQGLRRRITDPDQEARLAELADGVGNAISRLRRLLFELRPRALDTDGIAAALHIYFEHVTKETGLTYELHNLLTVEPPMETRIVLYRIAQEALTNAWKHAHGTRVEVTLDEADGGVLVRVRDDGKGFDADQTHDNVPGHLGLVAMRERAETAGGWLRIRSGEGMGATVEFWLPLEQEDIA